MSAFASSVLLVLAEASIRVLLLAAVIVLILAALRVRENGARHAAWTALLMAMLLMPILPYGVPAIAIAAPPAITLGTNNPAPAVDVNRHGDVTASSQNIVPPSTGASLSTTSTTSKTTNTNATAQPISTPHAGSSQPVPAPMTEVSKRPIDWAVAIVGLYALGVLIALGRLTLGWIGARTVVRTGKRILPATEQRLAAHAGGAARLVESGRVATPVTIGVVAPTVVLPLSWRDWPDDTLRAVLAHETAHITRRDPLVVFLARVNRCVFWFHPMAWWLERTLAATAEYASDDRAVRLTGNGPRYAEVLLSMARTASARGGRWSWQGVGMDGRGLLRQRIERVLRRDRVRPMSVTRAVVVATSCVAAIVLIAACRLQASAKPWELTAAEEQRERKLRADLEPFSTPQYLSAIRSADTMPYDDLVRARSDFDRDPGGLDDVQRWLNTYWNSGAQNRLSTQAQVARVASGPTVVSQVDTSVSAKLLVMRRDRILWLIEQHPESALAGAVVARLFPTDLDSAFAGDPAGYAQAKALWLSRTDKPDVSSVVLGNASFFFEAMDRPIAERLLIRARAQDPNGPWSVRLGRLYAIALTGLTLTSPPTNQIRFIVRGDSTNPFGVITRRTLGESNDEALVTAAGWFMARATRYPNMEFDPRDWAASCFKHAVQLNPKAVLAHSELLEVAQQRRWAHPYDALWTPPASEVYAWTTALPESERFERLSELVDGSLPSNQSRWQDPNLEAYDRLHKDNTRRFAEDILRLAPKYRDHPRYGVALYAANMALGSIALLDGNTPKAIDYLQKASRVPPSEDLVYEEGLALGWRYSLARDLFRKGERDEVAQFLDRMADVSLADRDELREKAAAIRRGESPRL